jgi:hypothetical protein
MVIAATIRGPHGESRLPRNRRPLRALCPRSRARRRRSTGAKEWAAINQELTICLAGKAPSRFRTFEKVLLGLVGSGAAIVRGVVSNEQVLATHHLRICWNSRLVLCAKSALCGSRACIHPIALCWVRLRITFRRPPIRATSRRPPIWVISRRPPIWVISRRAPIRATCRRVPIRATSGRLLNRTRRGGNQAD